MGGDQVTALDQAEPRCFAFGEALQTLERLIHHSALLLGEDDTFGQSMQHLQPLGSRARLPEYDHEHADSQQGLGDRQSSGGNTAGEGRPIQMLHEKEHREHPRSQLMTAAAGAQQRNCGRQQNDSVADFQSDAQG